MHRLALVSLAALSLAACGKSNDQGAGQSGADANVAAAEAAFKMQAGQYRSTVTVEKVTAEGLPPQMGAMMGKTQSFEYCITPEQAAGGIEALKRQMADGKCQFESFKAAGGTVDSVFTCQSGEGMTLRSSSHGTYNDNGSSVAVKADMSMPGGKAIHIEQTVKAERIGDCAK